MKYKVLEGFVLPEDMRDKSKFAKEGDTISFGAKHKSLVGMLVHRGKIEAVEEKKSAKK